MKQLLSFIKKEFAHVFRDRKTLLMLFGLPVMQIMLFGFALTNEIKNARIVVLDNARDVASVRLINKLAASKYFQVERQLQSHNEIEPAFKEGKIKLAFIIPANFYNDLLHSNKTQVQVIADASDLNTATTLTGYISSIIMDYQRELTKSTTIPMTIQPEVRMLYNPEMKGEYNFVPGVMALVMMLVCVMMTSISIVREKELGTMEILLVSPFRPILVIIAKVVPYLLVSLLNVTTILILSVYVLHLPIRGNLFLLYGESLVFIIAALSLGLLISVNAKSQQSAMFSSMMGSMLPTLLLSGFMFPIENMPAPLQWISNIVPAKWYYIIVKDVMIKGLGFSYIWKETLILTGTTILLVAVSLKNFKIRLE